MRLEGKVALVTGAGRGIGRGIALAFAREGADLAIVDISADGGAQGVVQEIRSLGRRAVFAQADVSRPQDVSAMVERVVDELGRIDVLVNNAGILITNRIRDLDEDTWDRTMAINFKSVYLCSRAVVEVMSRQGGGRIINIASGAGISGGFVGTAYAASKAGVIGFTKALARELAPNIQVNAIAPGSVDTHMATTVSEETRRVMIETCPMKRLGTPDDIARAALFLAADAEFLTAHILVVDGGRLGY